VNPLDSCNAKLRQANAHAQALHEEIEAFKDSGALKIRGEADRKTSSYAFYVEVREEVPVLQWGCRIGDALHNLHSALDNLVWQLAIFALQREPTEKEAKSVSCPIALTRSDFDSHPVIKMLDPAHVKTLRGLQPYKRGDRKRAEGHPLAVLKRLSNIDKHRVVHLNYVALSAFPVTTPVAVDYKITNIKYAPLNTPLVDGKEIARVEGRRTGPNPQIQGNAKLSGKVALGDGTPAQELIDEIGDCVSAFVRQFHSAL
jgi:hypothetical protein